MTGNVLKNTYEHGDWRMVDSGDIVPQKNSLHDIKCKYCICLPQVQANHQEPTGTTLQESVCKEIIISVLQGLEADIAEIGKLWGAGLWFELRECHIFLETTISQNYLHISV